MTARGYVYRHLVSFDETNLVGNVYFAHYLRWQGHCRERFLGEHAATVLKAVHAGELALATVSCAMDFYAECFAGDEVDVVMVLRDHSGNRIIVDFDFRRDDQLVARGSQTVACLRRTGSGVEPVDIPPDLVRALGAYR